MSNLKDLKNRIKSVKSTQKITSAMKMVAAAKLRRAQDNAEQARPYSSRMSGMIASLAAKTDATSGPTLLVGTGRDAQHLVVVVSADRGLCGGFNGSIIRATRREIDRVRGEGRTIRLLMVGRKAADALRREFSDLFVDRLEGIQGTSVSFSDADRISQQIQSISKKSRLIPVQSSTTNLFRQFRRKLPSPPSCLPKSTMWLMTMLSGARSRQMNMSRMRRRYLPISCRVHLQHRSMQPFLNLPRANWLPG